MNVDTLLCALLNYLKKILKMNHIYPTSEKHELSTTCDCYPRVIEENAALICIHQSFKALELTEEGFEIGRKTPFKSRCGRQLIEGDIVETVQGSRFMVLTILKPILMLQNKQTFDLDKYMSKNLFFIGNVVEDLRLRNEFFYSTV